MKRHLIILFFIFLLFSAFNVGFGYIYTVSAKSSGNYNDLESYSDLNLEKKIDNFIKKIENKVENKNIAEKFSLYSDISSKIKTMQNNLEEEIRNDSFRKVVDILLSKLNSRINDKYIKLLSTNNNIEANNQSEIETGTIENNNKETGTNKKETNNDNEQYNSENYSGHNYDVYYSGDKDLNNHQKQSNITNNSTGQTYNDNKNNTSTNSNSRGLLIPFYIYPVGGSSNESYQKLVKLNNNYPDVEIVAILNPHNGPGDSVNQDYLSAINYLYENGIKIIGYVRTNYTDINYSTVKDDIDRWKQFYPNTSAIFFDEVSNDVENISYYEKITNYAENNGFKDNILNFGTNVPEEYYDANLGANYVNYENSGLPGDKYLNSKYSSKNVFLSYNIANLNKSKLNNKKDYFSLMYVTDDKLPNPWDTIPVYIKDLLKILS